MVNGYAKRDFTTIHALKAMITGYKMLFGASPDVMIATLDNAGMPTGVRCIDGEILFNDHHGHLLITIGTKYITVLSEGHYVQIDLANQYARFQAILWPKP